MNIHVNSSYDVFIRKPIKQSEIHHVTLHVLSHVIEPIKQLEIHHVTAHVLSHVIEPIVTSETRHVIVTQGDV